ncbi:maf protein, putative [Entamoeba dispar SAW760]|uniref:Maf protein, putative n=1 Tax=Entamoeba dispar (strain ATCC PRA-260 / SAW760) TaxID=370354 RepID=B0EFS7_ENTDS|nr:maf protein, putative [Entamoeba dispar SAW760]EDR26623.1 maf protein, putative [Entamoeba dispar SAW760]|eukprot:EDR26623.1 maf protein, putative [Entamoeba dispar SAW760]
MLLEYLGTINSKKIILASQSPRRKIILEQMGLKFEIHASKFEENLDKKLFKGPVDYVKANAEGKTMDVASRYPDADLIIGCDTVVLFNNEILEKPKNAEDASRILHKLSGNTHEVISVVCLVYPKIQIDGKPLTQIFDEHTKVQFCHMTDAFINKYIECGYCYDKAGAYGIQDNAGPTFISRIDGCYWNVVGFPSFRFCEHLIEIVKKYWN